MTDHEKGWTVPMKRWRTRRAALLAVCLSLALVAFGCAKDDRAHEFLGDTRIIPAMHNDMPGLSYKTRYPRSGFETQLLMRIEEWLGVTMAGASDVTSQDRARLLSGSPRKADMVVASYSITPDRMRDVDFVGPYVTTWQGILVGKGSDIATEDDLREAKVCTWVGTTSMKQLRGVRLDKKPLEMEDVASCVEALRKGRVDAVSTDQMILHGFAQRYAGEGLRVVPDLDIGAPQYYGIGLPKGYRADCERLREHVKKYVGSSDWVGDIRSSLPNLADADPEWTNSYRPSEEVIDGHSCRNTPSS